MPKLEGEQKEFAIVNTAAILLFGNLKTTTKEVKDALHLMLPGLELTQNDVSATMSQFFNQNPDSITKEIHESGNYFVYSLIPGADDLPGADLSQENDEVADDKIDAIAQTSPTSAVAGSLGNLSTPFLKSLDQNLRIAFTAGKADFTLLDVFDKFEARKLFKKATNAKHNDVRSVTIKTYLKKYC